MKPWIYVKKKERVLFKKRQVLKVNLKPIAVMEWRRTTKISQMMKENHVQERSFLTCLGLKISEKLFKIQKILRLQTSGFMKIFVRILWT